MRIVGVNPVPALKALDREGFTIAGGVPDVRPEYWGARVMAVPLLSGSGTRLKILEAAGAGLPIVSTSLGCEGIDVRHGEHLMMADSPDEFADACVRLLENEPLAERLAQAARRLAQLHYDWRAIGNTFVDRIEACVAAKEERPNQ